MLENNFPDVFTHTAVPFQNDALFVPTFACYLISSASTSETSPSLPLYQRCIAIIHVLMLRLLADSRAAGFCSLLASLSLGFTVLVGG